MEILQKHKKLVWLTLAGIVFLVAVWLRTYHFETWLYFKMDQARDAMLIQNALDNGVGYLPLLGPRAGATEVDNGYLRLGPVYYYMQYLAGVLSGGHLPASNAYPDLFFSLAVLPLLYLFTRLYFSRFNASLITAMYALSFLVVQYSRFAWNPNPLPFFVILAFYGLLRFFSETDSCRAKLWLALWAFALAVGAQLHFFGFFSLLGISGVMFLWHFEIWNQAKVKSWFEKGKFKSGFGLAGVAAVVFLLVSAPLIISDVYRKGENVSNFVQALSTKAEKKPLADKIEKNISESFKYYCLLTTSECYNGEGFDKKNRWPVVVTVLLLFAGVMTVIFRLVGQQEKTKLRRDFLFLLLTWLGVFFVLSLPTAFQIRPRFYIVVFAVPFLLLGMLFKVLQQKFGKRGLLLSFVLAGLIVAWNLYGLQAWFLEQAESQLGDAEANRTLILKAKDGVTLGQLQKVTDFMVAKHRPGAKVYYYVKPEHVAPLKFLLHQKDPQVQFDLIGDAAEADAQFFAVTVSGTDLQAFKLKFGENFQVVSQQAAGQITVSEIQMEGLKLKKAEMFFNRNRGKSDRVFWKDVFPSLTKEAATQLEGAE